MKKTKSHSQLGPVLAPVVSDALLRNEALEALCAYSLIRRDPTDKTLSIHRLVQATLQESLSKEEHLLWAERIVDVIAAAFPGPNTPPGPGVNGSWFRPVGPRHSSMPFTSAPGKPPPRIVRLFKKIGHSMAKPSPLYQRALHITETSLGPHHPRVASPLNGLAELYREQGKYTDAEPFRQRALRIWETSFGPHHPHVASPLHNLAILYQDHGKYEQAEPLSS